MRALFMFLVTILIGLAVAAYLMPSGPDPERVEALATQLPEAPDGWTAIEGQTMAQSFGGVSATRAERQYARGSQRVSVAITLSEQAVAAAEAAGRNILDPQMRALSDSNDGGVRIIERDGWRGWSGPVEDRAEATAFRDDVLIQVVVEPANLRTLDLFVRRLDWETLGIVETPDS